MSNAKKMTAGLVFLACMFGCVPDNPRPATTNAKFANVQTVGGYTFTYLGNFEDRTGYDRLVFEITAPDGSKTLAIRGYGTQEIGSVKRGKATVKVEK